MLPSRRDAANSTPSVVIPAANTARYRKRSWVWVAGACWLTGAILTGERTRSRSYDARFEAGAVAQRGGQVVVLPNGVHRCARVLDHLADVVRGRARRAKADRIDKHRDHTDAAALQRVDFTSPVLGLRGGDDHQCGAARQMARLQRDHLLQREVAGAVRHRQNLQDARQLARAAIRLDELTVRRVGHKPERAPFFDEIRSQRRGDGHAIFLGRRRQVWRRRVDVRAVGARLWALYQRVTRQIEYDPYVRQRIQLELLDQQAIFARGARPVDAVEAVPRLVIAHARRVGGDEMRAAADGFTAGERASRRGETMHRHGRRVDDDAGNCCDLARELEQPERVTAEDGHRPQRVLPAPCADRPHIPAVALARQQRRDHVARVVVWQRRMVADFQPQLRQDAGVAHCERLFERAPDL